jgi:hypothetical protein
MKKGVLAFLHEERIPFFAIEAMQNLLAQKNRKL